MANFYENLEQAMAGVAHNVESSMDDGYTEAPQVRNPKTEASILKYSSVLRKEYVPQLWSVSQAGKMPW